MLVYTFIILGVVLRLAPHLPNFAPVTALALFGGTYLPRRQAFIVPIAAMLVSDYFIGFYDWPVMVSVYGSFALAGLLGMWLRRKKTLGRTGLATFAASLLFYLITNAAVAFFTPLYPHTLGGLVASYINALPFFRNSLLGDFFYVAAFFGSYELVARWMNRHSAESVKISTTAI